MSRFYPNYKRKYHPFFVRLVAIWRIITCNNFILIDYSEFEENGQKGRKFRPLYRTNYDAKSEQLTLIAVYLSREEKL